MPAAASRARRGRGPPDGPPSCRAVVVLVGARFPVPGDGERGRGRCEREHSSREDAEPCGARSPPPEHQADGTGRSDFLRRLPQAGFPQCCAKLQHFRDGSPCERPPGLLPSCTVTGGRTSLRVPRLFVALSALLTGLLLAGLLGASAPRAHADQISAKRAQAQGVLAQLQRLDAAAQRANSAYQAANQKLRAGRAPPPDQPPGARRRARQFQACAAKPCEAARRDVHVAGSAVLARRPPRRSQSRRPHCHAIQAAEFAVGPGHRAHPAGGRVPAPDRSSADVAAQRAPPAAPARRDARRRAQPDPGKARLRAPALRLRPRPDPAPDLRAAGAAGCCSPRSTGRGAAAAQRT